MLHRYLSVVIFCLLFPLASGAQSLEFVRNEGQWDGPFQYKALSQNGDAYLSANSFTYLVGDAANGYKVDEVHHGRSKQEQLRFHTYRVHFEGANSQPEIVPSKVQHWYYNYFLGKDPSRWKSKIHPALALDYQALYPGVDLHVSSEYGNLKYEFIVAAHTNPDVIQLRFEGTDGLKIRDKNLIIQTSVGEVEELKPVAFQYNALGERVAVACRYVLEGDRVRYRFPEGYDPNLTLVIDPTVVFCTLTGSTADNWGYTATYDDSGNFYAGGIMLSYLGGAFPTTTGAFQTTFGGGVDDPNYATSDAHGVGFASDMAIMKLNATGTSRIWATYLGGSDNEQPHSIIKDPSGNLVVAGISYSNDFPTTSGSYDVSHNGGADIVVTKLNTTGSALNGSTYIGGSGDDGVNFNGSEFIFGNLKHNYGDNARSEVIVDRSGNVYVTASTKSSNFPVTSSAYQSALSGNQDAVIMKLNASLSSLSYSTYFGGSSDDAGYVLALDTAQTHFYVGGGTMSGNFPATTGCWKTSYQGGSADGFILRFLNSGSYTLQKSTLVGESDYDQVYGLQVDLENNVYAMGQTLGAKFPVTSGVYSNSGSSQFIIKMDSLLSTNIFSTVFGSGSSTTTNISPVAFLVDTCQNIYVSGWGGNLGFSSGTSTVGTTTGMPVTATSITAPLKSTTDGWDFYFMALSKNATSLLFGAFLGRNSSDPNQGEHVDGGTSRFDRKGIVYQGICANCGGSSSGAFPTTAGSWATTVGSGNCNEAALKIAFQLTSPAAVANGSPRAKGCPPLTVQFNNGSSNATSYSWNFMDGSPIDTAFQPKHTFTKAGVYPVRLIVYNPNACKVRDTTIVTITVDSNRVKSDFDYVVTDSCSPYKVVFTNKSIISPMPGAAARTSYTWKFGDGTSFTGANPPVHLYANQGSYTVTLIMRDTAACNYPDSVTKVITIHSNMVKAQFQSPDTTCINDSLLFINQSTNATGVKWYLGDGDSSTLSTPFKHKYAGPGSYKVVFIAYNPYSCNLRDTVRKTIRINKQPTADFTFAPVIPVSNKPVTFTNTSVNADVNSWDFGDGSPKSNQKDPVHLFRKTGTFNVCLTVTSYDGCTDTKCKKVDADIHTALDLPTGFSPNGDGHNDILKVRGGGIETMNLKIFNRWGEKIFETNDQNIGWDGRYKGKLQEVDAYAFILTATFIDGTSATKKGNVTLLR